MSNTLSVGDLRIVKDFCGGSVLGSPGTKFVISYNPKTGQVSSPWFEITRWNGQICWVTQYDIEDFSEPLL